MANPTPILELVSFPDDFTLDAAIERKEEALMTAGQFRRFIWERFNGEFPVIIPATGVKAAAKKEVISELVRRFPGHVYEMTGSVFTVASTTGPYNGSTYAIDIESDSLRAHKALTSAIITRGGEQKQPAHTQYKLSDSIFL
jgi:hypothetical protein